MKRQILLTVMALFIAIPLMFWGRTLTWDLPWVFYLYSVSRALALTGFVLILFQYVLSSRIKFLERGIGLDRLFIIHRTSGLVGVILVLIHPLTLLAPNVIQGLGFTLNPWRLVGVLNFFILGMAASAALFYQKLHLKYETWKTIHQATYVVLPLAVVHSLLLGSDLISGPLRIFWFVLAGVYVAVWSYKLWNRAQVRGHPYTIAEVVQETHDTWSLVLEGKYIDYRPGQFMILQLIRDGTLSESHPFTISSSPTWDRISVTIKSVGDFTSTISQTKTTDRAYVDAPYGAFSFLNHDDRDLVFIAGGIGITPFLSMLRYIYDNRLEQNITLLWGNKTEQDIPCRAELEKMASEMPSVKIVHVMTRQPDWPGERGYIGVEMLKKYITHPEDARFFICGPPPMMATVVRALRDLGVPKKRIHYERFAFR